MHPSATGAPHAPREGASEKEEEEEGEGSEKKETSFVGWAKARASRAVPTIFGCRVVAPVAGARGGLFET